MVAAAVIGSAVLGAGASIYAGDKAASSTQNATNASINQQNQALQQQAALSAPYRALGESAIPTLQNLLGLSPAGGGGGRGIDPSSGFMIGPGGQITQAIAGGSPQGAPMGGADISGTLRNMPGYQFALNEGLNSTKNQATAMGMGLSGNTLQALDRYSTGLADQTYQQEVGNFMNVTGMGQAAAAGQAANIGNAANNTSNLIMNQGNTMAGIQANEIAGVTKAIGGRVDNYMTLSALMGGGMDNYMTLRALMGGGMDRGMFTMGPGD
jgi:hypothetical protein